MRIHTSNVLLKIAVRHAVTDVTIFAKETASGLFVVGISFGVKQTLHEVVALDTCHSTLRAWALRMHEFLAGNSQAVAGIPLDLTGCSAFAQSVLEACRRIPAGETVSYSRLAEMAGYPRAIRAAASVMRNNRFPLVVPCHRVVAKNGSLGGFMGRKGGKWLALKKKLLELEAGLPKHGLDLTSN
jgi:methylated-DNA-[protein]-cysteine S-methyltransferase